MALFFTRLDKLNLESAKILMCRKNFDFFFGVFCFVYFSLSTNISQTLDMYTVYGMGYIKPILCRTIFIHGKRCCVTNHLHHCERAYTQVGAYKKSVLVVYAHYHHK